MKDVNLAIMQSMGVNEELTSKKIIERIANIYYEGKMSFTNTKKYRRYIYFLVQEGCLERSEISGVLYFKKVSNEALLNRKPRERVKSQTRKKVVPKVEVIITVNKKVKEYTNVQIMDWFGRTPLGKMQNIFKQEFGTSDVFNASQEQIKQVFQKYSYQI